MINPKDINNIVDKTRELYKSIIELKKNKQKMKNNQEIPKRWCILRTEENYKEVNKWFNKMFPEDTKFGSGYCGRDAYIYSENVMNGNDIQSLKVYVELQAPNHKDFTEITTEQFREWFLKDDELKLDKNIIGYKFKEEYKKFKDAAIQIILACGNGEVSDNKHVFFYSDKLTVNTFKEAGVLDIWFEPVFEEEQDKTSVLLDLSNTKIRIGDNPELSKQVQEVAFKLGWDWLGDNNKKVKLTHAKYLYFHSNGIIGYTEGNSEDDLRLFILYNNKEIYPSDLGINAESLKQEPCKNTTDNTLVDEPKWKTLCDMLAEELGYEKQKVSGVGEYYYNTKNEKCYIATKRGLKRVK